MTAPRDYETWDEIKVVLSGNNIFSREHKYKILLTAYLTVFLLILDLSINKNEHKWILSFL